MNKTKKNILWVIHVYTVNEKYGQFSNKPCIDNPLLLTK